MATVKLRPGADIQAAIDRHPEGTTFLLSAGVYRGQSLIPKTGQSFVGEKGAVLNGSLVVTGWRAEKGHWVAGKLPHAAWHGWNGAQPDWNYAEVAKGREIARQREDLFIDGTLQQRVGSLDQLGPGRWFFHNGVAHLSESPAGKLVEMGHLSMAFAGPAHNVTIRNLTVEKYATGAQRGAIDGRQGAHWSLTDLTVVDNHGEGVHLGNGMRIVGGSFSRNGQLGIGGYEDRHDSDLINAHNALILGVEVAGNNYAGYYSGWHAGGIKILSWDNVTIRDAFVHDNAGPGIWFDTDVKNAVVEHSMIADNRGAGVIYETSFGGTLSHNLIVRNRPEADFWVWNANIQIQSSQGVEVSRNVVVVDAASGNGIGVIHQARGKGFVYGPPIGAYSQVHGNVVVHLGEHGRNGAVTDINPLLRDTNLFANNSYIVPSATYGYWYYKDGWPLKTVEDLLKAPIEERSTYTLMPATLMPVVSDASTGDGRVVIGTMGNDTLTGGSRGSVLAGGPGRDVFVITPSGGADVILDFTPGPKGDVLRLKGFGPKSFEALRPLMKADGPDTVIILDGGKTLRIKYVAPSELTRDNLDLSAATPHPADVAVAALAGRPAQVDAYVGVPGDAFPPWLPSTAAPDGFALA